MNAKKNSGVTERNRSFIRITIATILILMIPLVAMQFTDEVDWDVQDFLIIGALLFSTGTVYELAVKKIISPTYRIIASICLAATLLLIWAELAVGLLEKVLTWNW